MTTTGSILKTIAYFDLFHYPVSAEEIRKFLDTPATSPKVTTALDELLNKKQIFRFDEFYTLRNDPSLIQRRRKGNEHAEELLHIANRIGARLYKFPFVKGVGISGSLSKNYADEGADIDFFIITQANRLWIARTLLHCLKKISYLTGKQHWYCMNYFIDEEALLMTEKNIFIATEVLTLKPVCGIDAMDTFFEVNNWANAYFPNYGQLDPAIHHDTGRSWFKKLVEPIFSNRFGDWLDNCLMRITGKRWASKEKHHKVNMKGNPMALRVAKHFGRPDPEHFQKKILGMLENKLQELTNKPGVQLTDENHFLRKEII